MPLCAVAGADREVVLSSALSPFCDVAADIVGIDIIPVARRIKLSEVLVVFVVRFTFIPVGVTIVVPPVSEDCSILWSILSIPNPSPFPCSAAVFVCATNKCAVGDCRSSFAPVSNEAVFTAGRDGG